MSADPAQTVRADRGADVALGLHSGVLAGLLVGVHQLLILFAAAGVSMSGLSWSAMLVSVCIVLGAATGVVAGALLQSWERRVQALPSVAKYLACLGAASVAVIVSWVVGDVGWPRVVALTLLLVGLIGIARVHTRGRVVPVVQLLWSVGILSLGAVYTVAAVTGISTGPGDPHALAIVTGAAVVAAAALVGILRSHRRSLVRKVVVGAGTSVLLLGTALAALDASRGLAERVEPPVSSALAEQDRPNLILITVDTLRADCPGFDGGRARTPNMDALARESVLFERAYSVSPWTRPSFASLFTSRYPSDVGVGRVLGREGVGTDAVPYVWNADLETGVEILQRAGYLTAAVVTNPNLTTMANADQGFDAFFHVTRSMQKPPARMVSYKLLGALLGGPLQRRLTDAVSSYTLQRAERVDVAAEAMLRSSLPRPALLWVHYMDPHDPYDAPTAGPEFQIAPNRTHTLASLQFLTAASRQRMQEAYIREIEYFDNWLGSLIDRLKARDLWDESIVVFLSDHGEEFWDHGSWGHGQSLYNEQLRVPLMIHLPDSNRGRRVEAPVSLLDVFPTLLALCGAEPHPEMEGRDRSALLSGGDSDGFEIFLETCMMGSIRKGIMNDRFKLIHDSSGDSYRLYDMVADPAERHNIMGRVQTPEISRLRGRLDSFTERSLASMADYSGREAGETPPELRDQLRDMGYLQ